MALNELRLLTGTEISIGRFYFSPFNKLKANDVYIEDLHGDTLLYAGNLSAGFDLFGLINRQLCIKNISLKNFTVRVEKDSASSDFNFQFLIDAFTRKDTVKKENPHPMTVEIDHIKLSNGRLFYDILNQPATDTAFNANHIHLHDFSAEISLKSIDWKNPDVAVKHLAFKEACDFELKDLSARISSDKQQIFLKDLKLALPHSLLEIPEASVDYTGYDIKQSLNGAFFQITIHSNINLPDLKAFFPPFNDLKEPLMLDASIAGKFPAIHVKKFSSSYGKSLSLSLHAFMENYTQWNKTPIELNIVKLNILPNELQQTWQALTKSAGMPEMLLNLGNTQLSASAKGHLPQMDIKLNLLSAPGGMTLYGTAGYFSEKKQTNFDLSLQTDSFNLHTLLKDTLFGNAGLTLAAHGQITNSGNLVAQADLDINRFFFNKYDYRHIKAQAISRKDSITFHASFKDPNAQLVANGRYHTPDKGKPHFCLQAAIDTLLLSEIHILKGLAQSGIHADIHADLYGKTPDEWEGNVSINKLVFKNGDGIFRQKQLKLTLENNPQGENNIRIDSDIIKASVNGHYSTELLSTCLMNTFHPYLPALIPYTPLPDGHHAEDFELTVDIQNTELLAAVLNLPLAVVLPGKIQGNFSDTTHFFHLQADFPQINLNRTPLYRNRLEVRTDLADKQLTGFLRTNFVKEDTTAVQLKFSARSDSIDLKLTGRNKSIALDGFFAAGVRFIKDSLHTGDFPDITGAIYPSATRFQNQVFEIKNCKFSMSGDEYAVNDFEINHATGGSIRIDGVFSKEKADSLTVDFRRLQVEPFLEMLQYNSLGVKAEIDGRIVGKRLLATPVFFTNNFTVKDILVEDKKIGCLDIQSIWSERRQGARLNITLRQENRPNSDISGYILPAKDSISLNVNLQSLQLDWLQPFTKNFLFGLRGEIGAGISINGKISQPDLQGALFFRDAVVGINTTNVRYRISDSILISPNTLNFNRFKITDFNGNSTGISGNITHKKFETFNTNIRMTMRNFLVLSNPIQTDSLFYGTLKLSGSVDITGTDKGLDVKASIREGTEGKVYVQLPEPEIESNRYGHIAYVRNEINDTLQHYARQVIDYLTPKAGTFSLPVNLSLSASITPDLTLGAIINPATKDAAIATGKGNIRFDCKMPNGDVKLTGNYIIEEGKCALSLQNITKKEFLIRKGSTVTFKGNPAATSFNVTAVYSLRADLVSLDESFANDRYLTNTRVKTNCLLNISGDINKMNITYDVETPDIDESVQRKITNLMYSDDIKIREVAYLLALGNFYPPEGNKGANAQASIWTSLASSTLSSQLNNLLSSALKENWSIGTNFHSNNDNFSDVEMDVNISSRFFNNRLTLNTNIGYKNNQDNNLTGDFQVEYKLTKTGELSLKAYNVTNDEYYRQSLTTQGLGITYRKESKTFRDLFRKTIRGLLGRKDDDDENNDNK
ncbi:MAG: translocation/assembly module TamB [Dysgonamonadaceae bacterium]|nr:translocation/assembly module TamB [Dysgonamonadaceae bacterium]